MSVFRAPAACGWRLTIQANIFLKNHLKTRRLFLVPHVRSNASCCTFNAFLDDFIGGRILFRVPNRCSSNENEVAWFQSACCYSYFQNIVARWNFSGGRNACYPYLTTFNRRGMHFFQICYKSFQKALSGNEANDLLKTILQGYIQNANYRGTVGHRKYTFFL